MSKHYDHIAINGWMKDYPIPIGLVRGFAGCLAGCILYECIVRLRKINLSLFGKSLAVLIEICGYAYLFYAVYKLPKSRFDYVLVFIVFILLMLGISGVTGLYIFYSHPKTKILSMLSTLFVLNHYNYNELLKHLYGNEYGKTSKIWLYFASILAASAIVYLLGTYGKRLFSALTKHLTKEPLDGK